MEVQPSSLSTVPVYRKHANNSKHNRLRELYGNEWESKANHEETDFGILGRLALAFVEHDGTCTVCSSLKVSDSKARPEEIKT